jgi:hypothetical protein
MHSRIQLVDLIRIGLTVDAPVQLLGQLQQPLKLLVVGQSGTVSLGSSLVPSCIVFEHAAITIAEPTGWFSDRLARHRACATCAARTRRGLTTACRC